MAYPQSEPPLPLREEQKRLTHEKLVDAAVQVFEEHGFRGGSIEQIAKRAGANRSTFYLHFKSKAELGKAMGDRVVPPFLELLRRLDAMEDPTHEDLAGWVDDFVAYYLETRVMNEVLFEAVAADQELAREADALQHRASKRVMTRYLDQFPAEQREAARLRLVLMLQLTGSVLQRQVMMGLDAPARPMLDALTDVLWQNLFATIPKKRGRAKKA